MKNNSFALKIILLLAGAWLASCGGRPKAPDISGVKLDLDLRRFDQDLFALKKDSVTWEAIQKLQSKYPDFLPVYFERIANITPVKDPSSAPFIRDFLFDVDVTAIYDEVQKQYANTQGLKDELTQAFRYYRYYFPKNYVPSVITYVFGFNYAVVATDSALCVALDQYLGKDFVYYAHLEQYIRYRKAPAYLVPDALRGWATTEFESPQPRTDLLDEMIFQGKIQYFLEKVMPFTHDTITMGYTAAQMKFCENNEYQIWSYFVENKLLYSKDFMVVAKYCGEAPFSSGMPKESPGRTGIWTGWQIVRSYMKRNKKVTLEQLMNNHNYKQILELSRYKPKR